MLNSSSDNAVHLDVIIPTLGVRKTLLEVIDSLEGFASRRPDAQVRVIVSFNTKPAFGRSIFLDDSYDRLPNFSVQEIAPPSYEPTLVQHRFCKFVAAGLRGCVGRSDEGA
jgi:hypothetical protein